MTTTKEYAKKKNEIYRQKMKKLETMIKEYQIENFQDAKKIYELYTDINKLITGPNRCLDFGSYYVDLTHGKDGANHFIIDGYEPFQPITGNEIRKTTEDLL